MTTHRFESGQRYGRLMLITQTAGEKWLCLCDCGRVKEARSYNMAYGRTTSCGCAHAEETSASRWKHGLRSSPEYGVWSNMKSRCSSPKNVMYDRYGGRGIAVCEEWEASFATFYLDMGPRPSPKHSIDRIDNDGHYCKGNCRWATKLEQGANISRNKHVQLDGESVIQAEAARRLGMSVSGLRYRLRKQELESAP